MENRYSINTTYGIIEYNLFGENEYSVQDFCGNEYFFDSVQAALEFLKTC